MLRSHIKSITKAFTWRGFAAIDTFALAFLITGKLSAATGIVGFELFTKSALFYAHERAWLWVGKE